MIGSDLFSAGCPCPPPSPKLGEKSPQVGGRLFVRSHWKRLTDRVDTPAGSGVGDDHFVEQEGLSCLPDERPFAAVGRLDPGVTVAVVADEHPDAEAFNLGGWVVHLLVIGCNRQRLNPPIRLNAVPAWHQTRDWRQTSSSRHLPWPDLGIESPAPGVRTGDALRRDRAGEGCFIVLLNDPTRLGRELAIGAVHSQFGDGHDGHSLISDAIHDSTARSWIG